MHCAVAAVQPVEKLLELPTNLLLRRWVNLQLSRADHRKRIQASQPVPSTRLKHSDAGLGSPPAASAPGLGFALPHLGLNTLITGP